MKKFICYLMAAIVAISCTKTYISPRTTVIVNGYIPYYGWNIPINDKGEYGIVFGNYIPATKATSENGHFVGPNECGYDSFNMFAFKDGEAMMNPYIVNWDGERWTYEIGSQELQYFDRNSTKYDFIGVIADNAVNANRVIKVGDTYRIAEEPPITAFNMMEDGIRNLGKLWRGESVAEPKQIVVKPVDIGPAPVIEQPKSVFFEAQAAKKAAFADMRASGIPIYRDIQYFPADKVPDAGSSLFWNYYAQPNIPIRSVRGYTTSGYKSAPMLMTGIPDINIE